MRHVDANYWFGGSWLENNSSDAQGVDECDNCHGVACTVLSSMTAASRWEWLDFDEAESRQVLEFLSQEVEGEGNDPLRIGSSVRDRISERLFPGTSTQYTRLRYVILTPAILGKPRATLSGLKKSQALLNQQLARANPNETGIIGKRKPERDFVYLYWTALRTWKLLQPTTNDDRDVTVANGLAALQSKAVTDEEGNALTDFRVQWDAKVLHLADVFWRSQNAVGWPSIHCRSAEVDYILSQWIALPNKPALAAVASQLSRGRTQSHARYPWELTFQGYAQARQELDHARAVSLICWGVQLAYNFALLRQAKKLEAKQVETTWQRKGQDLSATEADIDEIFRRWQSALTAEQTTLGPWTDASYWGDLGSDASRKFLASSAERLLRAGGANLRSEEWAARVKEREKFNPAPKLGNDFHLATWSGTAEMARRWDFRWSGSVRRLIQDAEGPRG